MHDERNKANAQHSTGPTTEEGKAASSRNSTKHGLFTQVTTLLADESQVVYDGSVQGWLAACDPLNEPEKELVLHIVDLNWRIRRASRWETKILAAETPDFKALNTISLHTARMRKQISATMKEFREMHHQNTKLNKKALEQAITVHQADIIRDRRSTVAAAGFVFTSDELDHAIHLAEHLRQSKEIVGDHEYELDIDDSEVDFVIPNNMATIPEEYDDDLLDHWMPSEDPSEDKVA